MNKEKNAPLRQGWETLCKGEMLFAEGSYMPFSIEGGSTISALAGRQVGQYLRIGWRHLF